MKKLNIPIPATGQCAECGREIPSGSNFCPYCGSKQNSTCDCWVLGEPYACGYDKCPGILLLLDFTSEGAAGTARSQN